MNPKAVLVATVGVLILGGCGGGGGGGSAPIDPPNQNQKPHGTALFRVDLDSGKVDVEALDPGSKAVFAGSAISFTSSDVVNEGDLARRRLAVSMRNNQQESLFAPIRIRFSNFANRTSIPTDLRSSYRVATIAGTGTQGTLDGPGLSALLDSPEGITTDNLGTIYFTTSDGRVRMLKSGVVSTLATGLNAPKGIAHVPTSNGGTGFLVVAESGANILTRVDPVNLGSFKIAGTGSAGITDNNNLLSATFNAPTGLHATGNVSGYTLTVTDANGGTVRVLNDNVTGSDTMFTLASGLTKPTGVTRVGNLTAVVETDAHRVTLIRSGANRVSIGGSPGFLDGRGHVAQFLNPTDVTSVNGVLFVSDTGNHRIRQLNLLSSSSSFSVENWNVASVSGDGTTGSADGNGTAARHNAPSGVFGGDDQTLLVCERAGHTLRTIRSNTNRFPVDIPLDGTTSNEVPRLANPSGFSPNGDKKNPYIELDTSFGPGQSKSVGNFDFIVPNGITAFEFVVSVEATTDLLAQLDGVTNPGPGNPGGSTNVDVTGYTGSPTPGFADGPLSGAAYASVSGIARADDGTLFIADALNHVVRRIDVDGTVSTIAGRPGLSGNTDGRADSALLTQPNDVACEPDGKTIYITQENHVVRRMFLRPDFDDADGNGITPGDPRIAASYFITTIAGLAATAGFADGADGVAARFNNPHGIVRTGQNQLFLVERNGKRVRSLIQIGLDGKLATSWKALTVAGATGVTTPGAAFADGVGGAARFNGPQGIAVGPDGDLYIADSGNARIRQMTPGGNVTTFAGRATVGYGDANNPLNSKLNGPTDVAVDRSGVVYFTDGNNFAVRKRGVGVQTVAGSTAGNIEGTGRTAKFQNPLSILALPDGNVLVGDASRIRKLQRIIGP